MSNKYAILMDNLANNNLTKSVLEELHKKQNYNVTIFVLDKEKMVPNPFAVFSMADYFNFTGVSIITSDATLEKSNYYPCVGPKILISGKMSGYLTIENFDMDLIEGIVNEHKTNDG